MKIYILIFFLKLSPGYTGYGQISNIHYENINVKNPLW